MHITDWFSRKRNTFCYGKKNTVGCLERNAILASWILPKFAVARCHQLNPITEYNSVSPSWSTQMSILRWFTPVMSYSNVSLKKQPYATHMPCSRLLSSGLLTSCHQIFFCIKSRPLKLILANTIEISFLFNIRHNI